MPKFEISIEKMSLKGEVIDATVARVIELFNQRFPAKPAKGPKAPAPKPAKGK